MLVAIAHQSSLTTVTQFIGIIMFVVGFIVAISTAFINRARMDAMQATMDLAATNVEQLAQANRLQHEQCERDRARDKEECDRQIAKSDVLARHALSEASAARSEVVGVVTKAASEAMMVVLNKSMETAAVGLAAGQAEIIDRLDKINLSVNTPVAVVSSASD